MGALLRRLDWAATPVGPMDRWPESLRTALRIVLNSRYPMFVWWGPTLTTFYNDAYVPVLGAKHPAALGRSGRETWREIWDVLGPYEEAVFERAEASYSEELLLVMERHGFKEETYFTFSYSPILEPDGRVAGLFCACTEDTSRVLGVRRMRALREVADRTAAARTPDDAVRAAAAVLVAADRDLPFTAFYLLDDDGRTARAVAATGLVPGTAACPASVALEAEDAADPWRLRAVRDAAAPLVLDDVRARIPALPTGPWDEPPAAALVLPLARAGAERPAGFAVLGVSPRLAFDGDYRAFCELVAGHLAAGVANARAYADERRRAEALAELDRAKTVFFSNVSHEFRTPLTLMMGPLEDLRRAPLGAAERDAAEIAHRNGLRLLRLVNDLLEFSRIEAGRVDASYERVDIASCTAELASVFRAAIERAGLVLELACRPVRAPVYVDRRMWEKIVLNLLSNAFKFTLTGRITVGILERDGAVALTVADTGVGIPADDLPHVFERFRRGKDLRGRTQEGSGIGLALVHELARLHGGTVTVDSEVGRGSTFTVTIPTGAAHLPPGRVQPGPVRNVAGGDARPWVEEAERWLPDAPRSDEPLGGGTPRGVVRTAGAHVLVADDNADMRAYLRRLLGRHWRVDAVADGAEALAAVRARRPDLVLADVMMPRLDGFELVRTLRADDATRALPIVLLSARAGEEARVEGLEAGADDYLVKPFSARELVAAVDARLEFARVRASAAETLRVAEERYRSLVGLVSSVVWIADPDGIFPEQNPSWESITGMAHEAYRGFGWLAAVHPDDRERVLRQWKAAIASGDEYFTAYRVLQEGSGAYHHVEARALPLRDDTGRIREWIGMISDVDDRVRIAEALARSEARLRAALDVGQVGTWDQDVRTGETVWSPSHFTLLGLDPARDVPGMATWARLVHPDDRDAVLGEYERARRERDAFRCEYRVIRTDGAMRWLNARGAFVYDADGTAIRSIGAFVDVTDEKRAAEALVESQARLELAQRVGRIGVFDCDMVSRRMHWSAELEALFGLEPGAGERTVEESWTHVHPDDLARCREQLARCFARGDRETSYDFRARLPGGGGERWLRALCRVEYDADGRPRRVIGVNFDVDEQTRATAALEEANARKDEFLAMLAHELRNPLAPIQNATRLLAILASDEPRLVRAREIIERQVTHLTRLVDDLLDVSRITRGKIVLHEEPVSLGAIVEAAVETVRPALERLGHTLEVHVGDAGTRLVGDFARLVQVVSNLLTNAAKFTPARGRIALRAERANGEVVVTVRDDGVGIAPELQARIFDLFVQDETGLARTQGGLGIGLTVVKRLVELHGGRVSVRSEGVGRGSEFAVRLPAEPPSLALGHARPSSPTAASGRGLAVLVVEDNPDAAESFTMLLGLAGHDVRVARDGLAALAVVDGFAPDVAFLDIGLPGLDGYELAARLRAHPSCRDTVLVAMTGYGRDEDKQRAVEVGFDRHLTKPVDHDLVDRLLASVGGGDAARPACG